MKRLASVLGEALFGPQTQPYSNHASLTLQCLHTAYQSVEVHGHFIDGKPVWSVIAGSGDNMRSGLGDTFEEALGKVMG